MAVLVAVRLAEAPAVEDDRRTLYRLGRALQLGDDRRELPVVDAPLAVPRDDSDREAQEPVATSDTEPVGRDDLPRAAIGDVVEPDDPVAELGGRRARALLGALVADDEGKVVAARVGEDLVGAVAEVPGEDVRCQEERGVTPGESVTVVERLEVVEIGPPEGEGSSGS